MNRIIVCGISGSGKTTLAKRLAARLGLPRHELDALHHGPGWVKRPEFEADVDEFSPGERWVTEDQYHRFLGDLLWQRADTAVWLDLPRRTVMWRTGPGLPRSRGPRARPWPRSHRLAAARPLEHLPVDATYGMRRPS